MKVIWKRSGVKPEKLENELAPELFYLWGWFLKLHKTRLQGMSGMQPITYQEIEAWSRLTGNYPSPWEVEAITEIDSVACKPKEKKEV